MLAALVVGAGGEPWILPTAADDARALDTALAQAAEADLLLITGGVSAGKFDLVEPALARAGARFHFTGVRIQPGKPLVFGEMPKHAMRQATRPARQDALAWRSTHAAVLWAAGESGLFGSYVSAFCGAGTGCACRES